MVEAHYELYRFNCYINKEEPYSYKEWIDKNCPNEGKSKINIQLNYMKNKGFLELKENKFEYIRVTGNEDQFADLKRFCGADVIITYESCYVDDFWLITLDDCIKGKKVTVPNYDYIVKIANEGFTVIKSSDISEYFNEITEDKSDKEDQTEAVE